MAHIPHQGAPTLKVWALGLLPFGLYPGKSVFAKGSRGGTWHVPRGRWRHVTNAIVVPALWRIFWCLSRTNRTSRSGVIHESPWTDWLTHTLTHKQARPSYKNPPYPEEISFIRMGLRPILLHYDFELVAALFHIALGPKSYLFKSKDSKIKISKIQNFDPPKFWTP